MGAADAVWGGLILAGAAFEVYALKSARKGDTLSESTRRWFRVHTKGGAATFLVAWAGFAVWYGWHIVSG